MSIGDPIHSLSRREHAERVIVSVRYANQDTELKAEQLFQISGNSLGEWIAMILGSLARPLAYGLWLVHRTMAPLFGKDVQAFSAPRLSASLFQENCNFAGGLLSAIEQYPCERTNYLPGYDSMIHQVATPFRHFLIYHPKVGSYGGALSNFETWFNATFGRAAIGVPRFHSLPDRHYNSDKALIHFGYGVYAPNGSTPTATMELLQHTREFQNPLSEPTDEESWIVPTLGGTASSGDACFYDDQNGLIVSESLDIAPAIAAEVFDTRRASDEAKDRTLALFVGRFKNTDEFSTAAFLFPTGAAGSHMKPEQVTPTLRYVSNDGEFHLYDGEGLFRDDGQVSINRQGQRNFREADARTRMQVRRGKPLLLDARDPESDKHWQIWVRFKEDIREFPLRHSLRAAPRHDPAAHRYGPMHPRPGDFILKAIYLPMPTTYSFPERASDSDAFAEVWLDLDKNGHPVTSPLHTRHVAIRHKSRSPLSGRSTQPSMFDYVSLRSLGSKRENELQYVRTDYRSIHDGASHWGLRIGFEGLSDMVFTEFSTLTPDKLRPIVFSSVSSSSDAILFDWIDCFSGARLKAPAKAPIVSWLSELYGNQEAQIETRGEGSFRLSGSARRERSGRPILAKVSRDDNTRIEIADKPFTVGPGDRFLIGPYEFEVAADEYKTG